MTGHRTLRRPLAAILAAFALVAGSETATANEERWNCCIDSFLCAIGKAKNDPTLTNDLTLTADRSKGSGTLTFDTITQKTNFIINGLARRWYWGKGQIEDEPDIFRYALVIEPDRTGYYYDFEFADKDGKAESRATYICTKGATAKPAPPHRKPLAGTLELIKPTKPQIGIDLDKLPQRQIEVEPLPPTDLTPLQRPIQ